MLSWATVCCASWWLGICCNHTHFQYVSLYDHNQIDVLCVNSSTDAKWTTA